MPTVWLGRMHCSEEMSRAYGPDYMLGLCSHFVAPGYRHLFYGGKPGVAEQFRDTLVATFPGLIVVGVYSPPVRP